MVCVVLWKACHSSEGIFAQQCEKGTDNLFKIVSIKINDFSPDFLGVHRTSNLTSLRMEVHHLRHYQRWLTHLLPDELE